MSVNSTQFERVVKRGQIYYVHKSPPYNGSREIQPKQGRPAVIVSRDEDNFMSGTVMVAYMTSSKNVKFMRDTQFRTTATKVRDSVVKCEQIDTVDKDCIGDYIGDLSETDLQSLNKTILTSIGLDPAQVEAHSGAEIEDLRKRCSELQSQLEGAAKVNAAEEVAKYKAQAERYKQLYGDLLKVCAGKDI